MSQLSPFYSEQTVIGQVIDSKGEHASLAYNVGREHIIVDTVIGKIMQNGQHTQSFGVRDDGMLLFTDRGSNNSVRALNGTFSENGLLKINWNLAPGDHQICLEYDYSVDCDQKIEKMPSYTEAKAEALKLLLIESRRWLGVCGERETYYSNLYKALWEGPK